MKRILAANNNVNSDPQVRGNGALPPGTVLIEGVSKRFKKHTTSKKSYTTIKSSMLGRFFSKRYPQGNFITALDSLNLNIEPGSSLGLIGRNGSGKSTLLKLIAGIYHPDHGSVRVAGKVSALIELGAGFHPDFTGRENIYLGGVMFGLDRKEIDAKYDRIVAYSGLEDFIDDPVRTYSSGMYMRLGFSLAVHTDPDILLIDEVLAVGDAAFVHKCQETISEFRREGKTLIFVAHDLEAISRWCDRAIWLESGKVFREGEPRVVIDAYLKAVRDQEADELAETNKAIAVEELKSEPESERGTGENKRWGSGEVTIKSVKMSDRAGEEKWLFGPEDQVTVVVEYQIHKPISELVFGVGITRLDGIDIFGTNTGLDKIKVPVVPSAANLGSGGPLTGTYKVTLRRLGLAQNSYYLDVAAHAEDGTPYDYHHRMHKFSIRSESQAVGVCDPERSWEISCNYPAEAPAEKRSASLKVA